MANTNNYWYIGVACLLLGAIVGAVVFSTEKVVTKEVPKEIKVPVEVIKEVPVTTTVTVDKNAEVLANALDEYYYYIDDENLLECNGDDYDIADVTQKGDIKELTISTDSTNRRDTVTTVDFVIKNKFYDGSDEHPCYRADAVQVVFHSKPSVDTEVSVD